MTISGQKLPLSSVYLNLLQARPVAPVAPASPVAVQAKAAIGAPAPATPAVTRPPVGGTPPRDIPRGSFVNILA